MTIKTFWTILLKLLGIYLVVSSLPVVPSFLYSIAITGSSYTGQDYVHVVSLILLTIGIYLLILRLFVFKTSWLIEKLHLEKGFSEDRINIELPYSTLLAIAIVIVGGFWFIQNLADFCRTVFTFFQEKAMFKDSPSTGWIIVSFINTVVGYLIMTNSRTIVAFIEKQTKGYEDITSKDQIESSNTIKD